MKRTYLMLVIPSLAAFTWGCGVKSEAPRPSLAPAEVAPPAVATSADIEPRKARTAFDVFSACSEVVTVVFAPDPRAPAAGKRTIAPSSSIEGPRDNDGNQTVWLLDTNGEPLVKVNVTRGMKRVEIGRSCRTLDAR